MACRCAASIALIVLAAGCSIDTGALGPREHGRDAGQQADGSPDAFVPPDAHLDGGAPPDAFVPPDAHLDGGAPPDAFVRDASVPPDSGPMDGGTDAFVPDACSPAAETCDGLDNDCDGTTDEGYPTLGDSCTEGSGSCMVTGSIVCNSAGDGTTCGATAGSGGPEECNGVDDDCDGDTDEALAASACPLTDGVCAGTTEVCGGTSGWISCGPSIYGTDYESTETTCDGLDNDCDGNADEGYSTLGDSCTVGTGACQATGSVECNGAGDGTRCSATPGAPGSESCNGTDDDCDGSTDEAWPTVGDACTVGMGACADTGTVVCNASGTGTRCTASAGSGSSETCNGADDDCDGSTDEGLTEPSCALTDGICAGTTQTCGGTSGWLACGPSTYGADYESTETTCDGLDNDCDGTADEGYPTLGDSCTVGMGACTNTGSLICNGAGDGVTCDATPGTGSAETCNGVDDDCNGSDDDGLTAPSCALTQGVCAGTEQTCGGSSGWLSCDGSTYGMDYEAGDETSCDGLDNDCDGSVDEGGACPCPVVVLGGSVYQFCGGADDWQGARDACAATTGWALVSIESSTENGLVWGEASSRDDTDWWIGLNDRGDEGTFTWVSGSSGTYRNWAPGQPNDFAGQDCASVDDGDGAGEQRSEWNDRECADNRPYVCELL